MRSLTLLRGTDRVTSNSTRLGPHIRRTLGLAIIAAALTAASSASADEQSQAIPSHLDQLKKCWDVDGIVRANLDLDASMLLMRIFMSPVLPGCGHPSPGESAAAFRRSLNVIMPCPYSDYEAFGQLILAANPGIGKDALTDALRLAGHMITCSASRPSLEPSSAVTEALEKGDVAYNRKDYAKAVKWYRKAADQGLAVAQYNLGLMYGNGQGLHQDYAEAAKWFRKAAEQGLAKAQTNVGGLYRDGLGVSQDYAAAAKWYRKAAEQGEVLAQVNLGFMYFSGQGVPQDFAEAAKWYRTAAEHGDSAGQFDLGTMYDAGRGMPQDYAAAMTWYRKAADQGNAPAEYGLGWHYANGLGVPQDMGQARTWMQRAATAGDENAKSWLSRVANPQAASAVPDCHDIQGIARMVMAANPGIEGRPDLLARTIMKTQELMGCRAPDPTPAPPTYYAPAPSYAPPTPPAYSPPPAPGPASTTCMPFGNGGTRCTTMVPGQAPTFTTCYPFGNGGTRCTTQ